MRTLALVLAVALAVAGCAMPSGPVLDEEQRCARWGGAWQAGTCKPAG